MGMTFTSFPAVPDGPTIWVNEEEGAITLTGKFRNIDAAHQTIEQALEYAGGRRNRGWTIHSLNARVAPLIVDRWCDVVRSYLAEHGLHYLPGELERALRFGNAYHHKHSTFPPEGT